MAEILIARTVCDRHQARHNKAVEGETTKLIIDGEEFEVDWCTEDRRQLLEKLLTELREYARTPKGKRPKSPMSDGPTAEVVALPKATKATKALAASNGKATSSGRKKPADPNKPRRYPCLWCDWKPFTTDTGMMLHGQGKHNLATLSVVEVFELTCPLCGEEVRSLGMHAFKKHDGATLPELFVQAQKDGDPHGIVEKVLAKGTP